MVPIFKKPLFVKPATKVYKRPDISFDSDDDSDDEIKPPLRCHSPKADRTKREYDCFPTYHSKGGY